jgi:hypothetical protein
MLVCQRFGVSITEAETEHTEPRGLQGFPRDRLEIVLVESNSEVIVQIPGHTVCVALWGNLVLSPRNLVGVIARQPEHPGGVVVLKSTRS